MSGPVSHIPGPLQKRMADALEDRNGWKFLEQLVAPAMAPDPFRPDDTLLEEIARYAATTEGARVIAWLHRISDLAPYPETTAQGFEHAALAAAKHQGRASVGHVIDKAVHEGRRLRELKTQGANP